MSWLWSRRLTEPPRPCGMKETEPLRPLRGHLPFQGRLCVEACPKGSLCGGSSPPRQSLHTPIAGKPMVCAIGFPAIQFPQRRMSAAALSAAVDSAKLIEATSNLQAEPSKQNHTSRTPTALRERGVWGERGFSQRSRLSPQKLPTHISSGGSAREGASLQRSPLPRIHLSFYFVSYQFSPW